MVKPFLCGAFPPEPADEFPGPFPPRKCRAGYRCLAKNNKNPYSNRGLDKFSSLLSELEEKRRKIYSQMDSQDIIVQFVYNQADDCVPVVVKQRYRKVCSTKTNSKIISSEAMAEPGSKLISVSETGQRSEKKSSSLIMKVNRWRRPSDYLVAIIILILLLMALFGRSMAILCTSIGWYVIPTIKKTSNSKKRPKKKYLAGRCSDTRIIFNGLQSPRRNNVAGAENDEKSHRRLGHQRSF